MGIKDIISKLPGVSTIGLLWSIISFILFLFFVLPPIYGIFQIFFFKSLPPFVPQDSLTKLGYGTIYGYYVTLSTGKQLLGFNSPVSNAKNKILSNSIIDVSANYSAYPQYGNLSLTLDSLFSNVTSQSLTEYYIQYCYAMGINDTSSPWSLDLYVVSRDGNYLISDFYIAYQNQNFTSSLTNSFNVNPHYGVIVTEDLIQNVIDTFQSNTINYASLSLMVISSLRNDNILLFQIS